MATDPGARTADATMDAASLYREEIYTDRKVGTLRVLVPVKRDGAPDTLRRTVYQGEAQLMTNMGPLPISFDIEAPTALRCGREIRGSHEGRRRARDARNPGAAAPGVVVDRAPPTGATPAPAEDSSPEGRAGKSKFLKGLAPASPEPL